METSMERIREKVLQESAISEFQRRVYLALLEVPKGETISYAQLGKRVGCRSPQAIGQALRRNPFAPLVPCHRVIRASGAPGGYFGKEDSESMRKKTDLLSREGVSVSETKKKRKSDD